MSTPANAIVHWPGKDTPACWRHIEKLKTLADTLGFALSITPAAQGDTCKNCENEALSGRAVVQK
jgi:hypothetical protein